jgi:ribonuclease HI
MQNTLSKQECDDDRNFGHTFPELQSKEEADLTAVLMTEREIRKTMYFDLRERPRLLIVHTSSDYVMRGVEGNLDLWQRRGWVTASGALVRFKQQWAYLDACLKEGFNDYSCEHLPITLRLVREKGSAGVRGVAEATRLAREATERYIATGHY